jgi:hypothetical protein
MWSMCYALTKALATFVAADPTRAKEVRQLHRGLSVTLNLTPGHEFTTWDFTSTSQDGSQGFRFAKKTYESILNGCGVDVSELSVYAREREVLVLPGARFRVVDIFRPAPRERPDFHHVVLERRPRLLQHDDCGRGAYDAAGKDDTAKMFAAPSAERVGAFQLAIKWPAAPSGVQRTDIAVHRLGPGEQGLETIALLEGVPATGGRKDFGADLWRSQDSSEREARGESSGPRGGGGGGGGGGGAKTTSQPSEPASRWWSPALATGANGRNSPGAQLSPGATYKIQLLHNLSGGPTLKDDEVVADSSGDDSRNSTSSASDFGLRRASSLRATVASLPATVTLDSVFPAVVDTLNARLQHTWDDHCLALDFVLAADGGACIKQAVAVAYVKEGGQADGELRQCNGEVDITEQYLELGKAVAAGAACTVLVRNVPRSWQGQRCVIDLRLRNAHGWNLPPPALLRNGAANTLPYLQKRAAVSVPSDGSIVPLRDPADRRRLERALRGGFTAPNLVRTMVKLRLDDTSMPFGPDAVTVMEWAVRNGVQAQLLAALKWLPTPSSIVHQWGGGRTVDMSTTAIEWQYATLAGDMGCERVHLASRLVRPVGLGRLRVRRHACLWISVLR